MLQKKAALREAKRAEALAAGCDYNSDDSDEESQVSDGKCDIILSLQVLIFWL